MCHKRKRKKEIKVSRTQFWICVFYTEILGVKYPCDQCAYAATRQSNLKQHKDSVHEGSVAYLILLLNAL